MVCGKCGKAFDESAQATEGRCPFCKTVYPRKATLSASLKGTELHSAALRQKRPFSTDAAPTRL